jgi:hypothetical protein
MFWLPEMARRRPARTITITFRPPGVAPPDDPDTVLAAALHTAGLTVSKTAADEWEFSLPGRTRVYGLIPREVDEKINLRITSSQEFSELVLSCHPTETHDAHAVGLAGVFVAAAALWFAGGLVAGMLPAATTLIAGALLVDVTRHWAFDALERRLRLLADNIGSALWPGQPAHITVA